MDWIKGQADRTGDSFGPRDLREGASCGVNAKDNDGIGDLVFSEEEAAGGIDGEVARFLAAGWKIGRGMQRACSRINGEDSNGVMSTIGCKEPLP
jgi:hypothetical protein